MDLVLQLLTGPCQWYVSCPENYECKINGILVPANLLSLEQVSFPASPLLLLPRPTHPALPAHTQPFPPQPTPPFHLLSILTLHSAAETMTTGLEYMFGCKLVLPITGWCFPIKSRSKAAVVGLARPNQGKHQSSIVFLYFRLSHQCCVCISITNMDWTRGSDNKVHGHGLVPRWQPRYRIVAAKLTN